MASTHFKGALSTATFPMVSILQGRTVLQPQLDVSAHTRNAAGAMEATDTSIPQVMYMENVLPTGEGYQSVGYTEVIAGLPGVASFDQAITIRDEDENNFIFSPAAGMNYIYTANNGAWQSVDPIDATGLVVTRAYVNGRTFIAYEGLGVYEYDVSLGTFTLQVITGVANADVTGIGSSSNYLLIFTVLTVHWSSLIDPLDFVPSLTTGAGFAIPQDVKARITAILGIAGGFIIYTAKNAVAAVYTNNARAPFTFKEVSNAGGITTYEQVTSEQSSGPHYAWTTGGLQKITIQGSEPVSAEVNDFLAGKMYETYSTASKSLTQFYSDVAEFPVKLALISSRWLVVSYATSGVPGNFDYALVYDTSLKRWGKLKIDHVDCFYYPYPNLFGDLTYADLMTTPYSALLGVSYDDLHTGVPSDPPSKLCMGFLQTNGTIKLLEADYYKDTEENGVIIFGKFQQVRSRLLTMQQLELEGVYQNPVTLSQQMEVYVAASFDGDRPDNTHAMKLLKSGNKYAKYAKRVTGVNFSVIVEGTFALSSYIIEATNDGSR